MVVVLMGVSGSGKSSVGRRLAERPGWVFHDGDDFHPPANVAKMAAGRPLTDADREPWLETIHRLILQAEATGVNSAIACSALKAAYRRRLLDGTRDTRVLYLRGSREELAERLARRRGHFFDPALLESQFDALEEPTDALVVDVGPDLDTVVANAARALDLV